MDEDDNEAMTLYERQLHARMKHDAAILEMEKQRLSSYADDVEDVKKFRADTLRLQERGVVASERIADMLTRIAVALEHQAK